MIATSAMSVRFWFWNGLVLYNLLQRNRQIPDTLGCNKSSVYNGLNRSVYSCSKGHKQDKPGSKRNPFLYLHLHLHLNLHICVSSHTQLFIKCFFTATYIHICIYIYMGVSKNQGALIWTPNSRALIIRTPKQDPHFWNPPYIYL